MISYPLVLPTNKAPNQQTITPSSTVAESVSGFTGTSQTYDWMVDRWLLSMSYPKMAHSDAAQWMGALSALKNKGGVFYAGPALGTVPLGSAARVGTNLLKWSDRYFKSEWGLPSLTLSTDYAIKPEGMEGNNASSITGAAADSYMHQVVAGDYHGQTLTFSVWLMVPSGTRDIVITIQDTEWHVRGAATTHLTTTWQRFSVTGTMHVEDTSGIRISIGGGTSIGIGAQIFVWGAQLELGSSTSPYIGTSGSTNTQVNGANQTGRILCVDGCPPNSTVFKSGDWFQYGAGYDAVRIQSSGGDNNTKLYVDGGTSINGKSYVASLRAHNFGQNDVAIGNNIGTLGYLIAGTETSLQLRGTGNGVSYVQQVWLTGDVSQSIDVVAWDPVIRRYGVDENFIPVQKRKFSGWVAYSGATITLTGGIAQRLLQVTEDVVSDANGNAEIPVFPALRHSPFDNEPLVFTNPKGVFRLTEAPKYSIDVVRKYGFSISAQEAL